MGVLTVDGLRLSEVVRVAERYGAVVVSATQRGEQSELVVSMDAPTANAISLALLDVPMHYEAAPALARTAS